MSITRCGVIGLGTIGRLYCHLVAEHGASLGLAVTAAADPNAQTAPEGVALLRDHAALLRDTNIDAVLIATPPSLHAVHARDSLEAVKDVLVEKPPAASVRDAEKVIELAQIRRRVLVFAYHARYGSAVTLARSIVREHTGRGVTDLHVVYRENVTRYHRPGSWVMREGVLRDSGINVFSVLTQVIAQRISVSSSTLTRAPCSDAIVQADITLQVGDEGRGRILLDWVYEGSEARSIAITANGVVWLVDISADRLYRDSTLVAGGDGPNSLKREYEGLLRDFAACVRERRSACDTRELWLVEEVERLAGG